MRNPIRVLRVAITAGVVGTCFQLGGCSPLSYIANINPCGTILECDPVQYEFITSGYEGPGARPDIDPFCTYPPFCDGDPFVSSQVDGDGG